MKKQRKHCTPGEKAPILKGHLVEGVPISDLWGSSRRSQSRADEMDSFRVADDSGVTNGMRVSVAIRKTNGHLPGCPSFGSHHESPESAAFIIS
jgi:hypothetical protein